MQRKRFIEILIALLVLLALLALLWFLLREPEEEVIEEEEIGELEEEEEEEVEEEVVEEEEEPQNVAAPTIARTFVERFGSYSTDGGYENVEDVIALATPSLAARLTELAENARKDAGEEYYGVSTQVLSMKTVSETETQAELEILTQRTESIGSPGNSTTFYQSITVELVKDDLSWLVDDFVWY